jgi:hypothetical protein
MIPSFEVNDKLTYERNSRAMTQFVGVRQTLPNDQHALTARPLAILTRLVSEAKSSTQETALSTLCDIGKYVGVSTLPRRFC